MSQAIESDATASSPAERMKILVADDEANIRRVLETRLALQGHDVKVAENGNEALELFRGFEPDVVVLDVMMPELDGFAVVERIRAQSEVPIIMLTALGDVADRITGLQLGADDYMVKPFSPKELEARIRCVLRRASTSQGGVGGAVGRNTHVVMVGDLSVDFNRRQAHRGDERIRLTGMEFNLLELLISRSGEPISRLDMLEKVWGLQAGTLLRQPCGGCAHLTAAGQARRRPGQSGIDPHRPRHGVHVPAHPPTRRTGGGLTQSEFRRRSSPG